MTRFKVIGLAVVAVLALSAVVASGASAATFHSGVEHTHFTGHFTSTTEKQKLTAGIATVECETIHLTGTELSTTKESSTVTVHPEYAGNCEFFGEPATVTTTGCNYVFHAETTSGKGHVDVACEGTNKITVATSACTIKFASQTGTTGGIVYSNIGSGATEEIGGKASVANVAIAEKTGPLCGLLPNTGSYSGESKVGGYKATPETMGEQTGVFWE